MKLQAQIYVVIATSKRQELLGRTLASLVCCFQPKNFGGVIIVENGLKPELEPLFNGSWAGYKSKLKIRYFFHPEPNKSSALNSILHEFQKHYLYFLDDDLKLAPDCIEQMELALTRLPERVFLGGPVAPDFVWNPPEWLLNFVPNSVRGYQLAVSDLTPTRPNFLGANWLAHASDILAVNGFVKERGPKLEMYGEEIQLQRSLKDLGLTPYYVPKALVLHFIPPERCEPSWVLERGYRHSFTFGRNAVIENREFPFILQWLSKLLMSFRLCFRIAFEKDSEASWFRKQFLWNQVKGEMGGVLTGWRTMDKSPVVVLRVFNRFILQVLKSRIEPALLTLAGFWNSIVHGRDQLDFLSAKWKYSRLQEDAIPLSIQLGSLAENEVDSDCQMSLAELRQFLAVSEEAKYRFYITLTGSESISFSTMLQGVQLLKGSKVCKSLGLKTNLMFPRGFPAEVAFYLDWIQVLQNSTNLDLTFDLIRRFPDKVSLIPVIESRRVPKRALPKVLPAHCLSPEIQFHERRIYPCSQSRMISNERGVALDFSIPLANGFIGEAGRIRQVQESYLCAYCTSNGKVSAQLTKISKLTEQGWRKLVPVP